MGAAAGNPQSHRQKVRYVVAEPLPLPTISMALQAFKDHTDAIAVAQERAGEYKENEETADEKPIKRLDQRRGVLFSMGGQEHPRGAA